jgi:DNA polymerase-1
MYRARYATRFRTETSAIFNFFRSLRSIYEEFEFDIAYMVLEGKPVKRIEATKKLFGESTYKSQRVYEDKDNFSTQRKEIQEMLKEAFPIKIVKHPYHECDDICNYYANYVHKDDEVTIISSDTDFIQSINEKTRLYNPLKKAYIKKPEFDYVLFKALKGDSSDNIEGFKGVGEKTALKLCNDSKKLNEFIDSEEKTNKLLHNKFMVKFHVIDDIENIEVISEGKKFNEKYVFDKFTKYEFKSIIENEKYWKKFKETFNKELK